MSTNPPQSPNPPPPRWLPGQEPASSVPGATQAFNAQQQYSTQQQQPGHAPHPPAALPAQQSRRPRRSHTGLLFTGIAIVAAGLVVLFVSNFLPYAYVESTPRVMFNLSDMDNNVDRFFRVVIALLWVIIPAVSLLVACSRPTRAWDSLKAIVGGVPLAYGVHLLFVSVSNHYYYSTDEFWDGVGIATWMYHIAAILVIGGAVVILVAIVCERTVPAPAVQYSHAPFPSANANVAAAPHSGDAASQAAPYPMMPPGPQPQTPRPPAAHIQSGPPAEPAPAQSPPAPAGYGSAPAGHGPVPGVADGRSASTATNGNPAPRPGESQ